MVDPPLERTELALLRQIQLRHVRRAEFPQGRLPPELVIAGLAAGVGSVFMGRCGYLVLMSIVTVLGALVSWHLLEKHFLRLKHRFEPKKSSDQSRESVMLQPALRSPRAASAD